MKNVALIVFVLAMCTLSHGLKAIVVNAKLPRGEYDEDEESYVPKQDFKTLQKLLAPRLDSKPAGKLKTPGNAGKVTPIKARSSRTNQQGLYPWHVAIIMDETNFCSGSLIHAQWVLTTARCVKGFTNFTMTLGSDQIGDFASGRVTLESTTKYVHSLYSAETLNNNVALIMLPVPISEKTATINVVRLPKVSESNKTFAGVVGYHSGYETFAVTDGFNVNESLISVSNKVIFSVNCSLIHGTSFVTAATLCLSNVKETACIGDNGGPLVYKETDGLWTQIGIHSFGSSASCMREEPSGFVRTSSHLGWISSISGRGIRP